MEPDPMSQTRRYLEVLGDREKFSPPLLHPPLKKRMPHSPNALPTEAEVEKALDSYVLDKKGQKLLFGSVLGPDRTIVVFIRKSSLGSSDSPTEGGSEQVISSVA
jgi:hypothetical protein